MTRQQPSCFDQCAAAHLAGMFLLGSLLILFPHVPKAKPKPVVWTPAPVYKPPVHQPTVHQPTVHQPPLYIYESVEPVVWTPAPVHKPPVYIYESVEPEVSIQSAPVWIQSPPKTIVPTDPQCYFAQNVSVMSQLATGPTVVVGSENHLLSHLPLPRGSKLLVFEPRKKSWDLLSQSVDPMQVQLRWGLFSERHKWLQLDVTTLEIEPYDTGTLGMYTKTYLETPELLPAGALEADADILMISHWRYWCYFTEKDPISVQQFKTIIVLNPEARYCDGPWKIPCHWHNP